MGLRAYTGSQPLYWGHSPATGHVTWPCKGLPTQKAVTVSDTDTPEAKPIDYFHGLVVARRGNSARGRSLHTLYFLDFVWARPLLPLHNYRPSRRPVAFTAMIFDLLGDASRGYTEALLEGAGEAVRDDLRWRLETPWSDFLGE